MRTHKLLSLALLVAAALFLSSGVAWADWNEGDPAKWVQLPDLDPTGLDVNATWAMDPTGANTWPFQKTLADDFLCTSRGPITGIHVWGSWLNDLADPKTTFRLTIYGDVPVGPNNQYSHPDGVLWERYFSPAEYEARIYKENLQEQFYEPNELGIIGRDTMVWQYNFLIDRAPFIQEGTPDRPRIYWLGVEALVPWKDSPNQTDQEVFGWKTSLNHWNDDAVFGDPLDPQDHPDFWRELRYPVGHPFEGRSIDLAFVIVPEPSTWVLATFALLGGAFLVRRYRRR